MKSRVIVGAIIAFTTLITLILSAFLSPWLMVGAVGLLILAAYTEVASWSTTDYTRQTDSARLLALKIIFGVASLILFIAGGIALAISAIYDIKLTFSVFAIAYASDTAAVFVGRGFSKNPIVGKRNPPLLKFAPSKTIAGFIGATLGGLFAVFVLMGKIDLLPFLPFPARFYLLPPGLILTLAPLIVIVGDILGSGLKRTFGIKDSGQVLAEPRRKNGRETLFSRTLGRLWRGMLPHGGFLDRFGSVFLLALFILLCVYS